MDDYTSGLLSLWLRSRRFGQARPYLQGRILDYGCGVGALAELCRPNSYVGMDTKEVLLDRARKDHPGYRFVKDLSETERFDTIVSLAVLEHVDDPAALLKKFGKMLNPSGRIILTLPHPGFEWIHQAGSKMGLFSQYASQDHRQRIDYNRMQNVVKASGLIVVKYRRFLLRANQLFILAKP